MSAHYLFLRVRLDAAARAKGAEAVCAAMREETRFGPRLMDTDLIHRCPLVNKEFYRCLVGVERLSGGAPGVAAK